MAGQWEFYWDQTLLPTNFANGTAPEPDYVKVPGSWHQDTDFPLFGHATYRLRILLPEDHPELALNGLFPISNYRLYVNGKLRRENGEFNGSIHSVKSDQKTLIPLDATPKNEIDLILHVSNHTLFISGLAYSASMGSAHALTAKRRYELAISAGLIASVLIIAIYHIGIYILRAKDPSSLYFALFCFSISVHLYASSGIMQLMLAPDASYAISYRLFNVGWFLAMLFFFRFFFVVFPKAPGAWLNRIVTSVCLAMTLLFLFTTKAPPLLLKSFQVFAFLTSTALVGSAIVNAKHRYPGSYIFIAAMAIFLFGLVNDMLAAAGMNHGIVLKPYTTILFMLLQAFLLSHKFSTAFHKAEQSEKEIRRLNADLNERDRARTLFFHNTSHELRTPLNGILGFTDLILNGRYGKVEPAVANQIYKIKSLSQGLKEQVDTILDIAKSKRGSLRLINSKINLNQLLQETQNLIDGLRLKKNQINVTLKHNWSRAEEPIFINDRDKIRSILRNLIGNAFKFTPDDTGQFIKIELRKENSQLTITVQDSGIGIAKDKQSLIFEEFKQIEDDARRSYEGTGLGLAMVHKIVEITAGKMSLISDLGQGTNISIVVPEQAHADVEKPAETIEAEPSFVQAIEQSQDIHSIPEAYHGQHNLAKKNEYKILVIDDNQINCEVISDILTNEGFEVITAYGGREGFQKACNEPPSLILLDLMMPEVSGEDVLRMIKSHEDLHAVPVILLTARASENDRIHGLELGADDYLAKPIAAKELDLKVRNTLLRLEKIRSQEAAEVAYHKRLLQDSIKNICQKLNTIDVHGQQTSVQFADNVQQLLTNSSFTEEWLNEALTTPRLPKNQVEGRRHFFRDMNPADGPGESRSNLLQELLIELNAPQERVRDLLVKIDSFDSEQCQRWTVIFKLIRQLNDLLHARQLNQYIFENLNNLLQDDSTHPSNLKDGIEHAIEMIRALAPELSINFECEVGDDHVFIETSHLQFLALKILQLATEDLSPNASPHRLVIISKISGDYVQLRIERQITRSETQPYRAGNLSQNLNLVFLTTLVHRHEGRFRIEDQDNVVKFELMLKRAG
jgi:signal transduction histidine kinase